MMKITGVILAGGCSSRMGEDKSLLRFGDRFIIEDAVQLFRELFTDVVIVSNNDCKFGFSGIPEICDIYEGRGPLGGIHAALKYSKNDAIFVVACDTPNVSAEVVKAVIAAAEASSYNAAMPMPSDRAEPLFALYKKEILPICEEYLEENKGKLHALARLLRVNYVERDQLWEICDVDKVFFNMNTPADYHRYLQERGGKI